MKKILLLLTFLTSIYSFSYAQCTPSVTISSVPSNTICYSTIVTFTTVSVNAGSTPLYEWFVNNVSQGTANTSSTHSFALLNNGDEVNVKMTSNDPCVTAPGIAISNNILMTVQPIKSPIVSLSSDKTIICSGEVITFTATPANGGTIPTYEWKMNGVIIPSATTNSTYTTTSAGTYTVEMISNAPCAIPFPVTSNAIVITVSSGINPGIITSEQTICYNTVPAAITQMTAPTGIVGTPTYQWEVSLSAPLPYSAIAGATNATFTSTVPITQDVYIHRVTTDPGAPAPCNVATSNVIHITVRPQLTAGVIGSDETICSGASPAVITQTTAPTGGTGTYTYQWQADATGPFVNIPGATNSSYTPPALTATTRFHRVETSGCGSTTSQFVTKSIATPEIVTASIIDPGQVCSGTSLTFIAIVSTTGTGTFSYQWFLGSAPVGTNSATYNYISVIGDNGKTVRVVVTTSTGCNAIPTVSNLVTLNIVGTTTPTITIGTDGSNPNCAGFLSSLSLVGATNAGNNPTFQWYVNSNPVGTGTTYSAIFVNGDQVWLEMTSTLNCIVGNNPYLSNTIVMDIRPIPNPIINEGDQTICAGESFTFTSTSSSIISETIWQWFKENTNSRIVIPSATNSTYTATEGGTYWLMQDNGACNSSNTVTLTVDPCGGFSSTITGPNPIIPGQQNAVYRVANQTGFTYTWSITGGTIVSGQNTNRVIVDWDAPTSNAFARTTAASYSISVLEKNSTNQTKTTTATINTTSTGTTLSQAQSGINIFPNPTTGSFNIEMPESGITVSYEILDLTGLSVASGAFTSTGGDQNISADLVAGMYQIVLKYNNVVTCVRLSKLQ